MTFLEIQKRVGKNIKRYDDTNGWKSSPADILQDDVKELINEIYLEELVPLFINKYPQDFRTTARADSWVANGTASAGLTSNTITTTTNIFANAMVGLYIRNETDNTSTKIIRYNAANSVDVQLDDTSTWSNDSVYVLGQEFTFGGDTTDIYQLENIKIKYSSTDTYARAATIVNKPQLFRYGWEIGSQQAPTAYLTSLLINGVLTSGVGILPAFQNKVTGAIEVGVLVRPPVLVADATVPRLPVASALIAGATARAFENKHDFEKAAFWEARYEKKTKESLSRYVPSKAKYGTGILASKRIPAMFGRRF